MKHIFTARFWKYFVITFLLVLLISALGTANHYYDLFLAKSVPLKLLLQVCLHVVLGLIPSALCISIALASFVSFKDLPENTTAKAFFRTLGIGVLCLLPVAVAIYQFDLHVAPSMKAKTMESLWEVKTGHPLYKANEDYSMSSPGFKNYNASLSTKEVLDFRLDSLEAECNQLRAECSKLLAQLPDTSAAKVYDAYNMEWLGIDYRHAPSSTTLNGDSIMYIQEDELYYAVENFHETYSTQLQYRFELTKRKINALALLLEFLVFAILGYLFRRKTMRNVLGILAIIIVAGLFIQRITAIGERYAEDAGKEVKVYEKEMRAKRYERR